MKRRHTTAPLALPSLWGAAEQGRIIRKEQDGLRILLDLDKQDRASAIQAIKDVLSQLED